MCGHRQMAARSGSHPKGEGTLRYTDVPYCPVSIALPLHAIALRCGTGALQLYASSHRCRTRADVEVDILGSCPGKLGNRPHRTGSADRCCLAAWPSSQAGGTICGPGPMVVSKGLAAPSHPQASVEHIIGIL